MKSIFMHVEIITPLITILLSFFKLAWPRADPRNPSSETAPIETTSDVIPVN